MGSQPNHTISTGSTTQLGITIGTYHPSFGYGTINDTTVKQPYSQQGAEWGKAGGKWDITLFQDASNLSSDS